MREAIRRFLPGPMWCLSMTICLVLVMTSVTVGWHAALMGFAFGVAGGIADHFVSRFANTTQTQGEAK